MGENSEVERGKAGDKKGRIRRGKEGCVGEEGRNMGGVKEMGEVGGRKCDCCGGRVRDRKGRKGEGRSVREGEEG